ncbi:hypothetical protein MHLNE_15900 [Moorella humiferrea]|uniref:helix-turn-helix domain-containing protein n=1 Tax=Neomoorella humiferrea TaxID=676965 RepID=UPI0030CEDAC7
MQKTLIIDSPTLKQGFTTAPNAVLYESRLSVQARWLYCILLSFAWQENECWPGQERIAEVAGWHVNTVEKYLKELRDFGLISWKRQGFGRPNIYYIHDPSKVLGSSDSQGSVNQDSQASVILDSHASVNEKDSDNNINNFVVVVYNNNSTTESKIPTQGSRLPQDLPCHDMTGANLDYHPREVTEPERYTQEDFPHDRAPSADNRIAYEIQQAFTKVTGRPLDEKALEELANYPLEYVLAKIAMVELGKDKTNVTGWLIEACREDYQHLPFKRKRAARRAAPSAKLPDTSKDDKYRDLYRLV